MDYKAITQAAQMYKKTAASLEAVSLEFLPKRADGKVFPLKELFRIDTVMFMMFLSSADGTLSRSEVELLDAVTGCNTDAKVLAALIKEYRLHSVKFAVKTPKCLQAAVNYGKSTGDMSVAEGIFKFYRLFGGLLIESYNGAEKPEEAGLKLYLKNLENFINKN